MMQLTVERFGDAKSKWGATVRYGLLMVLFLAGIACVLASVSTPTSTAPVKATDEQVIDVKQKIADLEHSIAETTKDLAEENDPGSKEVYENILTQDREKLDHYTTWLEKVKNARSAGTCFTADMRVLTADGARPIGQIKVGEKVLSVDANGRQVAADVLDTLADRNRHYYLINGRIKVTGLHRFFTDAGWKRAKELAKGDRIQTSAGSFEEIAAIEWVPADDLQVYNLTIAENHNFFISPDGKSGYLVHNSGGGGGK